jgi:hypothetical protein
VLITVGVPITSPSYWHSNDCTDEILRNVFRSCTEEEIPMMDERIRILREAAEVLCKVRIFTWKHASSLTS